MVPRSPTATVVLESRVATPDSRFPWGSGFCQYQLDWASELTGCKAVSPSDRKKIVFVPIVPPLKNFQASRRVPLNSDVLCELWHGRLVAKGTPATFRRCTDANLASGIHQRIAPGPDAPVFVLLDAFTCALA